jgi:hypothetical protein
MATTTGQFRPSTHGLHFTNYWPVGTPDYTVNVPIVGDVTIGDANNGLCGGMVFTVADLYNARLQPPPDTTSPAAGSPLFGYLAARLIDSFNIPNGILTYYYWANTPDHDTGLWPVIRSGLARMTIEDQVPQIIASIDRDRPAALGLVTVSSFNPGDLAHCHQVLAYGYEWVGSRLTLRVYDPNRPDADDVIISLDTSDPGHTNAIQSNVSISAPIRGLFYTQYGVVDPSGISGPPQGSALRDAVFVSQRLPTAVVPGERYQIAVTMRNSGIQTWTPQQGYRLGAQHPPDNQTWGRNRAELAGTVAPGQEATFTFDVTAPQRMPAYLQWRVLQEKVEWFGESTPERVPAVVGVPVRYGTTFKLRHAATDCSLHSHPISYGHPGSSGQQQVTCFGGADDNDLWRVKASNGQPGGARSGQPVEHGDIVRLEHVATRRNLHSHQGISSPVSGQQEVSCYGQFGVGDENDDWCVDIAGGGRWEAGTLLRLVHVATNAALHSHRGYAHPVWTMGQQEVTAYAGRDSNDLWFGSDFLARDARFVSQSAPASMVTGQSQIVTVVMRNLGSETWLPGSIRLGSQSPADNQVWGPSRLDITDPVGPGEDATFSIQVTAPPILGLVKFQWRLLQDGVEWFGDDTPIVFVRVLQQAGPTTTPDVLGMVRSAAEIAMKGADLVARFTGAPDPAEVAQQTPAAGTVVSRGTVVTMRMVKLN